MPKQRAARRNSVRGAKASKARCLLQSKPSPAPALIARATHNSTKTALAPAKMGVSGPKDHAESDNKKRVAVT